jgi:hypothetical protein
MKKWPYAVKSKTVNEINAYCKDPEWQSLRLKMKGQPTEKKLRMLKHYRDKKTFNGTCGLARKFEVQIDNYIDALKRGGQLNMQLEVVR